MIIGAHDRAGGVGRGRGERVFVICRINIGSSVIHNNELGSLINEIYLGKAFFVRARSSPSRAVSPSRLDSHCQTKHHVPLSIHSISFVRPLPLPSRTPLPRPMTGVITFLCCSDTRWYVTGSICPGARVRNSERYLLGIARRGETRNGKLRRNAKCDSAIANTCVGGTPLLVPWTRP